MEETKLQGETIESPRACGCQGDSCPHETEEEGMQTPAPSAWNEEVALAFLVALTPLAVLTFFGQIGLL